MRCITEVITILKLSKTKKTSFFLAGLLALSGLSFTSSAATVSVTTQGASTWTVPAGVTTINVVATGAGGGGGYGQAGGKGGVVTSTLSVTAGQVLNLYVGGHGGGSAGGGGGGGGSTHVDAGSANQIIAGGGGGGAGGGGVGGNGNGGRGGDAGNGNHPTGGFGGSGGVGGAGGAGGAAPGISGGSGNGGPGGLGGTAGSAGAGTGSGSGALGAGGSGCWCGAGGGGYGGGGSGGQGNGDDAGGGGGGSTGPAGSVFSLASNAGASRANGGDGSISISYTYAAPTITSLTPSSGSLAGGTAVTVTGSGFLAGATVAVGGVSCSSMVVASSTSLTCVTGAHAAGAVNVVVTNTDTQTGTLASGYTYNLLAQATLTAAVSAPSIRLNESSTLSTTGGSGTGAVTYTISSGPCSILGNTLSGSGVGTCVVLATKSADNTYQSKTAVVSLTVSAAKYLATAAPPVGVAGSNLNVLNLGGSDGPAMTTCLRDTLRTVLGANAEYQGQTADGSSRIGQPGQIVSFYALDVNSDTSLGSGINLTASNPLNVLTNCGRFLTVPAVYNLSGLGVLLNSIGFSAQFNPQGVMTVSGGGIIYVARPDYVVTPGAPGAPSLALGADGQLRFMDASGDIQILYPAFLDPDTLGNQIGQAVNGSVVIQIDGRAIMTLRDGTRYLLTPDLTLGTIPAEQFAAMWWQEGSNRYRYRTPSIFNTSQGFTVKALP